MSVFASRIQDRYDGMLTRQRPSKGKPSIVDWDGHDHERDRASKAAYSGDRVDNQVNQDYCEDPTKINKRVPKKDDQDSWSLQIFMRDPDSFVNCQKKQDAFDYQ